MSEARKSLTIAFSKGLDKASLPFEADPARALDEVNYVWRDGKVQKRFGREELLRMGEIPYLSVPFGQGGERERKTNPARWNGLWRLTAEDGQEHLVAHVGRLLFELCEGADGRFTAKPIPAERDVDASGGAAYVHCYEFLDERCGAFVGAKSLWFLGGTSFVRVRFRGAGGESPYMSRGEVLPVANAEWAYVPTTSISVTYEGARASGRASLDQVNLLCDFRKNLLLTGVGYPEDSKEHPHYYEYRLDSPIVCADEARDMARFSLSIRARKGEEDG